MIFDADAKHTKHYTLQEEVNKLKQLLSQSEAEVSEERHKRKEASAQVVRLTEVKALLQQQLEDAGGGTVAEKQVLSEFGSNAFW